MHPETKHPIALEYLKSIGVNPAQSVEGLIVSHWHADHIKGASKILAECPETSFYHPAALLKKEFLSFLSAYSGADVTSIIDRKSSSTKEFESIVLTLKKNCEANATYKDEYIRSLGTSK